MGVSNGLGVSCLDGAHAVAVDNGQVALRILDRERGAQAETGGRGGGEAVAGKQWEHENRRPQTYSITFRGSFWLQSRGTGP